MKKKIRIVITGLNEYDGSGQAFAFSTEASLNRKGNIYLPKEELRSRLLNQRSVVPFIGFKNDLVFNRCGKCISHPPSKRYKKFPVNAEFIVELSYTSPLAENPA